jgi:flagellar motor switch protein FliG
MTSALAGKQKAAAIIVALGADKASKIYKYLQEEDIEQLTIEIAQLKPISPEDFEKILEDFYAICLAQKVVTEGGIGYARDVLEKAFGNQMASNLLERVTKTIKTKAFEFIRKADYKNLLSIIQNEHPQTIALVLSYARTDQAAAVISELPKDKKIAVVERIAKMDRTSPEVIKQVEEALQKKFMSVVSVDFTEIGGISYIADVMNNMDRGNEKFVFDELSRKDMKLADEIRKRMFVFEDIITLSGRDIQRFIREVDSKDLVLALKGANKEVGEIILSNMSQRMQDTIRSELEYTHNVRLRDVEEAQQRIVSVIRRLEEEGELVITKGGKEEIIV